MKQNKEKSPLREALASLIPFLKRAFYFSLVVNVLVLAPSAYMMEVYDRVVNSRSHTTLLMLTLLVVGAYLLLEALEWVRRQVMHDAGMKLDKGLREQVFGAVFMARIQNIPGVGAQALRDLKTLREFLPSPGFLAFIDTPLALLVLVIIFLMAPALGWFAVAGALVQFMIGVINERRIREPLLAANRNAMRAQTYADGVIRNAQVIESMGMLGHIHKRWMERQQEFLWQQAEASDHAGTNSALSKLVQSLLTSLLLGMGCWLTLKGELHGSGMIVASILGGRVLAPLVQVIGSWRQVEGALESFSRLEGLLKEFPLQEKGMSLPEPTGFLAVEGVIAGAPRSPVQILKGVSFRVAPGGSLAIVGPSASGKTTLARLLVGVWPAMQGKVRLDGNDIYQWDKEELGQYIGYLPQNVELFEGTIAENVARFGDPDDEKVHEACRMVGLSDFIETLPKRFDTQIGDDGSFLSGGERQRVALARAVYGMPKFVVLDEPNASLDEAGDAALLNAVKLLRARGTTVIVITHRLNILGAIEHMLVLVDGQVQRFGTCQEVMEALQSQSAAQQQPLKPKPQG
ncbi:type I secretion system permease/ATPase [Pelodictyon phaeoclathratiforme]|uniref:Type I secretion system ATPase n=1 Tax=Pelodictyon phaeoclathratiforme (strain DSM 5477 / BU-1) TaxID=324925 RepID=B4SCC7_PELPB|nr:type I secretion system permease/ATPase [Pelodictyon phaeoclathratiforme]ACF42707.1 type I secretion system ATPase [Pelodictyon phaeoclathratiforme BU-1]MBV5288480.1 type I secretion system permease/ATPase [Pelodictyon phaeoclathratiforme]